MGKIARFYNWLTFKDFESSLEKARLSVIKRFARGNVMFQKGYVLNEKSLDELRCKGDLAAQEINKRHKAVNHAHRQGVS